MRAYSLCCNAEVFEDTIHNDLKLIRELREDYGLEPGVDYPMFQTFDRCFDCRRPCKTIWGGGTATSYQPEERGEKLVVRSLDDLKDPGDDSGSDGS